LRLLFFILFLIPLGDVLAQPAAGPERVRMAVLRALEARIPGAAAKAEVAVERISPAGSLGADVLTARLPDQPVVPRGRIQVSLKSVSGPQGRAIVRIAHFDSVATVQSSTFAGEPVRSSDLRFFWIETTRFSGDPLTPTALANWGGTELISRRSLRADRPLRTSDLGPPPAAEAGDPVLMTYRRSAFVMDVTCTSRDRGLVGDVIRLYADDTDTMYRARLTARGRAEWLETL
jgi:flagellar basal body P-ring formation protein FlgA